MCSKVKFTNYILAVFVRISKLRIDQHHKLLKANTSVGCLFKTTMYANKHFQFPHPILFTQVQIKF